MILPDALGQKIRSLRVEKGLSQQQLADLMFVTRKTVGNWESGARMPDVATLSQLAKLLGVRSCELLDVLAGPDTPPNVILVDDEAAFLLASLHILSDTLPHAEAFGFQTGREALNFAAGARIDVAFLDVRLVGESGIELAKKLMELNPRINIIFLTGHSEYMADALRLHCSGYLLKPLTPEKIREEIAHLRYGVRGLDP